MLKKKKKRTIQTWRVNNNHDLQKTRCTRSVTYAAFAGGGLELASQSNLELFVRHHCVHRLEKTHSFVENYTTFEWCSGKINTRNFVEKAENGNLFCSYLLKHFYYYYYYSFPTDFVRKSAIKKTGSNWQKENRKRYYDETNTL